MTLNTLLSFAQFERELPSERARDKIAASRKKGKWTGGNVPLGYDARDKRLVINHKEASTVRMILDRYLALRSFQKVIDELNEKGVVSKVREAKGRKLGGVPFTYGPLAYRLKNRTYLGEMGHKGASFPGEHKAIIDQRTFDQVQEMLKTNSEGRTGRRHSNGALLTGLLFDDKGNRMSPSFTVKRGVRYYFYVSSALLKDRKSEAGSKTRIASDVVEGAVVRVLSEHVPELADQASQDIQAAISQKIDRVVLSNEAVRITLRAHAGKLQPEIRVPRPALTQQGGSGPRTGMR